MTDEDLNLRLLNEDHAVHEAACHEAWDKIEGLSKLADAQRWRVDVCRRGEADAIARAGQAEAERDGLLRVVTDNHFALQRAEKAEAALVAVIDILRSGPSTLEVERFLQSDQGVEILALIDKPAHVNKTPKSEHDARTVLTPDPHILRATIEDLRAEIADLTRQLQGQPRRPQDVAALK